MRQRTAAESINARNCPNWRIQHLSLSARDVRRLVRHKVRILEAQLTYVAQLTSPAPLQARDRVYRGRLCPQKSREGIAM